MRFHEFWTNKVRRREANVPCGDRRSESSGTTFSGIWFPAAHYRLLVIFYGFNFKLHENLQAATRGD